MANLFDNVKAFIVNNLQKAGGKIGEEFLKNLQIKGSGMVQIDVGEIKVTGVNLNLQVIDTDNKNAKLVDLAIPLNVSVKPTPVQIPIVIEGDLK